MKRKKVVSAVIYTAVITAAMLIYCFISGFTLDNIGLYSLFLGDFSIGICSRLLVGSIISLFKETITREWLISFLRVVTVVTFFIAAHYAGSTLSLSEKTNRKSLTLFILMFVVCPFSITVYAGDIFGFIDVFCMIVLLMTAYFAENRILVWAVPVLIITGIFIHDSYITGYMAPCLGIVAYIAVKKHGRKLWTSFLFIISSVIGFATSFYTLFFSRFTITKSVDEVLDYLAKKGNTTVQDVSGYLEDILMWVDVNQVAPQDAERNATNNINYMFIYAVRGLGFENIVMLLSIIPVIGLIFFIWIKAMKQQKTFADKIPYILFMLTPVPQLMSLLLSIDYTRFLSTILITQTLYLLLCIRQKDSAVSDTLRTTDSNLQYFALPLMSVVFANLFV